MDLIERLRGAEDLERAKNEELDNELATIRTCLQGGLIYVDGKARPCSI